LRFLTIKCLLEINNSFCFGEPNVTANKRGDIGISLALGGKAGGGGNAAQAYLGISDEFSGGRSGNPQRFRCPWTTAGGVS
jgi:hypothetical protein